MKKFNATARKLGQINIIALLLLVVFSSSLAASALSPGELKSLLDGTTFYDPTSTTCDVNDPSQVAPALSSSSLTFPSSIATDSLVSGIKQYITKINASSVFLNNASGADATIKALVNSAQHANETPFLAIAIAQQESSLGNPSDYNIEHGHNSFGRSASGSQPSFPGAGSATGRSWYKWASVIASVDYQDPTNHQAPDGDQVSFLRQVYGKDIDKGDLSSLINTYAPAGDGNDPAGYTKSVQDRLDQMTTLSGGTPGQTATPTTGASDTGSVDSCVCSGATGTDNSTLGPSEPIGGHTLPAATGTSGNEEPINTAGQVPSTGNTVTFAQNAKLGQAYRDYYINMRWRYVTWDWDGSAHSPGPESEDFYTHAPRVLVTNPRTHKSIIADILESGPAPWVGVDSGVNNTPKQGWVNPQDGTPSTYTGLVSGFPPVAAKYLDFIPGYGKDGDKLVYSWAPDQTATPGPVTVDDNGNTTTAPTDNGGACGSDTTPGATNAPGVLGWEMTGPNAMITYDMGDPRWANKPYGDGKSAIGVGGCGITSLAMVVATFKNNKNITPATLSDQYGNTYHGADGTDWSLWPVAAKDYSLKETDLNMNWSAAAAIIKSGGLVIISVDPGHFTNNGHLMVLRAVTADGGSFWINDPNGDGLNNDSEAHAWTTSYLETSGGAKHLWGFTR